MSKKYEDVMDQDIISLEELNEHICPVCNCVIHSEKVITDCFEQDCPYDSVDVFYMDGVQELDFND